MSVDKHCARDGGNLGIELHAAAEFLIDHAYDLLFDPLPW
jgi:hypothetical protein